MIVLLLVVEMTTRPIGALEEMKVAMAGMRLHTEGTITQEEDPREDHLLHVIATVGTTGHCATFALPYECKTLK